MLLVKSLYYFKIKIKQEQTAGQHPDLQPNSEGGFQKEQKQLCIFSLVTSDSQPY